MNIKAISVRQPWASAILLGKDVENRSRYFNHRGPLLIHASLRPDELAMRDPRILALPAHETFFGQLIGIVNLIDCVRASNSRWADPRSEWKLILANPRTLAHPIPYRGSLGLFNVDHELVKDVLPDGFESDILPGMLALSR